MITNEQRITNQRQIIKEYLQSVYSHPTAEQVYKAVKNKLPRISLATVYRNLKLMAQNGDCLKIENRGKLHFDANTSFHNHFICQKCGRIYDYYQNPPSLKKLRDKNIKIGKIKNYKLFLIGVCNKCQRRKK